MIKYLIFTIGLLLIGALYLYFVHVWRPGCLLLWFFIPAYILTAVAIIER